MLDAGFGQLSCVFRCNIEPDPVHVDKRVVDAPEGGVCSDPADLRCYDLEVEALNERRDPIQRDADAAPVLAGGTGRNRSRRVSGRAVVFGSCMGAIPSSRSAVTTQMALLPDIGCALSACNTMKPAWASGRVGGRNGLFTQLLKRVLILGCHDDHAG